MPKFFNQDMAALSHQLTLSPRRLRIKQILGIERLLGLIQPDRVYPSDFVCFHITQYRMRQPLPGFSIPGKALIADLVTLAEVLSRQSNVTVAELGQPFESHQQLADRLKVSTKTIRRWRNRGLMGLRVVFEDGVNRLAFCKSTVDAFVERHRELVEKGASFKQLSQSERSRIVRRARDILTESPLKMHAVAKLIAGETGRAVETVRYTLRRHDAAHKEAPLFSDQQGVLSCRRYAAIWSCHESGESLERIARVFDCETQEIERILRYIELDQWRHNPIEYVAHELFDAPNADELILYVSEPTSPVGPELPRIPKDLPPYLRSLYLTPLLTAEQEQYLFRRYNYLKYKASCGINAADLGTFSLSTHDRIRDLLSQAEEIKQRIIQANLRLVVSLAKRHMGWSTNFYEVVSDGNMSLMRAVEKFDFSRGVKFSTYATWAVVKNYARSIPEEAYRGRRFVTGQEEVLEAKPDHRNSAAYESDLKRVGELLSAALKQLTNRERAIITHHFGILGRKSSLTLEQIGKSLGVTKERVRQIEQQAMGRLREMLSPSLVEALVD